ncbi:hypothetical protein NDA13_003459 [Ustilago tritici]|nr:hypothetical protein NDA13_003459 [Ustilago tritici]
MSASSEAEPERSTSSNKAGAADTVISSSELQLQRMDPDSILADDANPDQVLGQESSDAAVKRNSSIEPNDDDDEAVMLKRASAASAIFSQSTNSPRPVPQALSPDQNIDASASLANMSTEALQAQVKDLINQVTGLNEKLVKSFNRIADLEDDYSDAQERVRTMSAKIKELEKERAEHLDALNTGLLVEKAHVSNEMQRMMDRVIEETAQRGKAESDKSKIEAELDELSSSLFSEANKMVAVERLSRARAEEKSRNMEERLKDTEGIMLEQQKVLADLQRQVEKLQISGSRKDGDDAASMITMESDTVSFHRLNTSSLARSISQRTATRERKHKPLVDLAAEARLIINIVPYQEFRSFIAHLRKLRKQLVPFYTYPLPHGGRDSLSSTPTPRTASPAPQQATGSSATTNSIIIASTAYSQGIGSAFTSSPFAIAGVSRHRDYPTLLSNVENLLSLPSQLSLPFIKRSQEEDVEPCLRLDFAPGLNWLSRRQANVAILDGNLVIEPIFSGSRTIDEDAIRTENAHLPPAACAMCGIPVVNVPLPGGVAATSMSAEQGGKTSLVPSSIATATSSWASSAASSLGSITGSGSNSNSSSGTLTPKPSRGGLFASFRKSSAQNKSAEQLDTTVNASAPAGAENETQAIVTSEALVPFNLPVPTHIFRLSESSPTRYLLCPHHCLLRLRAVCQYWGFVRNLERSLVLEGKFMNEEQQQQQAAALSPAANASTDSLPKEVAGAKSVEVEALEKAVEEAEADKADVEKAEEKKAETKNEEAEKTGVEEVDAEKTDAEKEEAEKTEAEKIKEKVQEKTDDDTKEKDLAGLTEEEEAKESKSPESEKAAVDDDNFANTPSSPTEAKAGDTAKLDETINEDTAAVDEATNESSDDTEAAPATEADAAEKPSEADSAERPAEAEQTGTLVPPALPPRSVARVTGASSPSPAGTAGAMPKIPPRRHHRPLPAARIGTGAPELPPRTSTPAVIPAATAIYLDKLDSMEWEDKMWTEVTKLKEELWRARIGLISENSELI